MIAPEAPLIMSLNTPLPIDIPSFPKAQVPTKLPAIPMIILINSP